MKTKPDESACCPLTTGRWNPYVVGSCIGLLSILVFWLADKPLGMSTALSKASGALVFGFLFGWLLQRGGVTNYNVIVNQFRFKDYTVLKIMLTAVVVGGIGVAALHAGGLANLHIKTAPMLAIVLGSAIFGVGMVLYGYCPGTGLAAVATGSLHALAGLAGMMLGGILYALSFPWVARHILPVGDIGKLTLDQLTGLPVWAVFAVLTVVACAVFLLIYKLEKSRGL